MKTDEQRVNDEIFEQKLLLQSLVEKQQKLSSEAQGFSEELKRSGVEHRSFGSDIYEVKGVQGLVKIVTVNGAKTAKVSYFKPGANRPTVVDTMPLEKLIQKAKSAQVI